MGTCLPNFVVIGAPKCGTTSIYHYLGQHPETFLPKRKELHYFSYPHMQRYTGGPRDADMLETVCKSLDEYAAYYTDAGSRKAIGDVSPSYFHYSDVHERIRDELGSPRIILMLRDPVEKAFSQYMHLIRDNRETLDFRSALREEANRIERCYGAMWRYAQSSLLAERTQRVFEVHGRDRVKVILFDDLTRAPHAVMQDTFAFLGVDPHHEVRVDSTYNRSGTPRSKRLANFITRPNIVIRTARRLLPVQATGFARDVLQRFNTGRKPELDADSNTYLETFFKEDVARLEQILGRPLPWRARHPMWTH